MARGGHYVGETGMHWPTEQREYCNTTLSMFCWDGPGVRRAEREETGAEARDADFEHCG